MKYVNLLVKPASSLCNFRCKYCFYEDEAKNRALPSMGIMTEELADTLIRQAFEAVEEHGTVSFTFQGGEPTAAGLAFFRHFAETVRQCRPASVRVHFALQTNGALLDEDWAGFLKAEHFLVGLSLDGIRQVHNLYRVDPEGQGTWQRALAARSLLERHRVDFNALCVVTGPCAADPERVYRSLKNLGFRYMQFIACHDPIGRARGQELWSLKPEVYGKFLCELFDLWYQDWQAGDYHSIRLFDDYIHILSGGRAGTCATCGRCGSYLVLEGDGSAYPCDFFVLDEWRIGSLAEMTVAEMAQSEKAMEFLRWGAKKPAECDTCPYGGICGGGCKNEWYADGTGPHNYFCPSFKELFGYALPRMKTIARAEAAYRGIRFHSR